MKVSDLEGPLLDYWVARGEGHEIELTDFIWAPDLVRFVPIDMPTSIAYSPSCDWRTGGPLVQGYFIDLVAYPDDEWGAEFRSENDNYSCSSYGPTPLIAAMRELVRAKFGEEVPDL